MTTPQKLEIIQKILNETQTEIAIRLGVSFPTFNSWKNGKSIPRQHMRASIDELYLEVTGQKQIPLEILDAKKDILAQKSREYKNIVDTILKNTDIRDEYILKLTYHSNAIEGSTLTEPDTAAIIFDGVTVPEKTLTEHIEAKNHQTAVVYMLDHVAAGKPINEAFVMKLHQILMSSIRSDAGLYRNHGVRIAGVPLPTANHLSIPKLMAACIKKIQAKAEDIVSLVATTHATLEQIHPFSDGNGRVGRLVMNALLLKKNIAPAIIRLQQRQQYYTYLFKAQTQEDASQLESFLCETIMDGFSILERKSK